MGSHVGACYVPYLHLWCAAEVDACIGFLACGVEAPVHEHLEVGELFHGADIIVARAYIAEQAVLDAPVVAHAGVGSHLLLRELQGRHLLTRDRILHKTFPACKVATVEMAYEAFDRLFGEICVDGLALLAADEGQGTPEQVAGEVAVVVGMGEGNVGNGTSGLALQGCVVEALGKGRHSYKGAGLTYLIDYLPLPLYVGGLLHLVAQGDKTVLGCCGLGSQAGAEQQDCTECCNDLFHC